MKKFIHALVLAVFAFGCYATWAVLAFAPHIKRLVGQDRQLPIFTTLCIGLRPFVIALPILAAVYCVWVWFRKTDKIPSWVNFFAATMGVLVAVALPAMFAVCLPLVDVLNNLPAK